MQRHLADWLSGYRSEVAPKIVSIALTSRCNLRCVMCDHGFRNVAKQDFNPDLIEQIGDFIGKADIVDLTGLGEPLLSELFWKILDRFPRDASLPPMLMFNSNGLLLNEQRVERILAARMRRIRISIDSPDPATFAAIRDADLTAVVSGAKRLIERRNTLGLKAPIIGLEMTVMRRNLHQTQDMVDLTKEIGADFVEFWQINEKSQEAARHWNSEARGVRFNYAEELLSGADPDAVKLTADRAIAYAEKQNMGAAYIMMGTIAANSFYPIEESANAVEIAWRRNSITCPLPWQELRSDYDGNVTACCWGPRPIGDLRKKTMAKIWNDKPIREMRRELTAGRVPKACKGAECPILAARRNAN